MSGSEPNQLERPASSTAPPSRSRNEPSATSSPETVLGPLQDAGRGPNEGPAIPTGSIPAIGSVIVWQQFGFGVVVFSAALLAVPNETVEAARIDGAGWWAIQRRILIPQIRRIIEFFVILQAIIVLSSVFTYVYVLTGGGPAYSSSVMEYYIYQNGFADGSVGIASAGAVVLLAIASAFIAGYIWLRTRAAKEVF